MIEFSGSFRNIGCKFVYIGMFRYADDLSLLCSSLTGIEHNNVRSMLGSMIYYVMQLKVNYCTSEKIVIMVTCSQF